VVLRADCGIRLFNFCFVKLFVENWKMGLEFLLGGDCVCFLFLFGLFVYLKEGGSSFGFGFGQIKQSIEGDWRLTVK